jgi:MFS family permease
MSAADTRQGAPAPAGRARRTLYVATSGTLLVLAVFSAFVVAVGDSSRSLGAGIAGQSWALSGMSLGLAAALLAAGSLADDLGYGRVLTSSAGLLAAASVAGAIAPDMTVLIAARVMQGVAGGGVLAASLGSIGRAFAARTRATAVWGASVGAGITAGPLAAAGLEGAFGWRSGFWLEAAAAAALMAAASGLREPAPWIRRRLDATGIATLAAGMTLLTAALVEAHHGWTGVATIALFGTAGVVLAAFTMHQMGRRYPMLDPRLFGQPRFVASVSGALFTGLAVVGLMSYAPSFLQGALGLSELGSAAVLATWSATSTIVALAARSLPTWIGTETRLAAGLGLAALGEVALASLDSGTGWTRLVPGLIVLGVGTGVANAALGRIAVESVPQGRAGVGSGANNTARYPGGAAGVALVITIASATDTSRLGHGFDHAALVSAGLCALGAAIVATCRLLRRIKVIPPTAG